MVLLEWLCDRHKLNVADIEATVSCTCQVGLNVADPMIRKSILCFFWRWITRWKKISFLLLHFMNMRCRIFIGWEWRNKIVNGNKLNRCKSIIRFAYPNVYLYIWFSDRLLQQCVFGWQLFVLQCPYLYKTISPKKMARPQRGGLSPI